MNLLGIETSSQIGSVALAIGGAVLAREIATPREQTEQLLKMIDELLAEARLGLPDLDAIAFGRGPGSFTGLRVSAAVAQGLSVSSGVPLVPVSSLMCLAERARREHDCRHSLVCVDAHMGEVYWAEFDCGTGFPAAVGEERLDVPSGVVAPVHREWSAVGNGFVAHAALAEVGHAAVRVLPELVPSARDLLVVAARELAAGRTAAAPAALPVYLRDHSAWRRQS